MSDRDSPRWSNNQRQSSQYGHSSNQHRGSPRGDSRDARNTPSGVLRSSNWNDNSSSTQWRPSQPSRFRDGDDFSTPHRKPDSNRQASSIGSDWDSHSANVSASFQRSPNASAQHTSPHPNSHAASWNSHDSMQFCSPKNQSRTSEAPRHPPTGSQWSSASSGWAAPNESGSPSGNWGSSSIPAPNSGWNAPIAKPSNDNWSSPSDQKSSTGWESAPSQPATASAWDAPIVRNAFSSVNDLPPKKVQTREDIIEELFGSSLHPVSTSGINFDKYDNIPVDLEGDQMCDPIQSFSHLALNDQLLKNVQRSRYSKPTPIQKYAIPIITTKRDLMACAQTGSGKTAAFLIPAINSVLGGKFSKLPDDEMSRRTAYPMVTILSPTRELALQIHFEIRKFCFDTDCNPVVVYGGQDLRIQARELAYGCDILVATPGRLTDFLDKNRISLKNVQLLILDEADRMLDMGFEPQIRRIIEQSDMVSSSSGRQTVMFSATYPRSIQRLANQFLLNPLHLTVGRVGSTTDSIHQLLEYAEDHTKREVLLRWIPKINGLAVIFVATKRNADMIADWFRRQNIGAVCIHGDRTQEQREDALQDFRSGKVNFLVATDVAARGLDIANVLWVINYDLPNTIDDYIHRIGRTGRCGNTGTALSFINERSGVIIRHLYELLKENDQNIPGFLQQMVDSGVPEREQFHRRDGRPPRDRTRSNGASVPVFRDRNAKAFEIG